MRQVFVMTSVGPIVRSVQLDARQPEKPASRAYVHFKVLHATRTGWSRFFAVTIDVTSVLVAAQQCLKSSNNL